MTQKLVGFRMRLAFLLAATQALGRSREISLATTSLQSGRMLLGSVAELLGSPTPYPQADNPASREIRPTADMPPGEPEPDLPADPVAAVKTVRAWLEGLIVEAKAFRAAQWPRWYGRLEEVLFDRALGDLVLGKQWLGEQLAVIAGHPVVKPQVVAKAAAGPISITDVIEVVGRMDYGNLCLALGAMVERVGGVPVPVANGTAPERTEAADGDRANGTDRTDGANGTAAAALERGIVDGADGATLVDMARNAVDDTIRTHLEGGATITEICRILNVTEYRVRKIRDGMRAAAAPPAEGATPAAGGEGGPAQ